MSALLDVSIVESPSLRTAPGSNTTLDFLGDMQATFQREKSGIAGSWQYSDSEHKDDAVRGALLWQAFLKASNDYYPLSNEIRLIRSRAKDLIEDSNSPITLVDIGPGPVQAVQAKTIPIAKIFNQIVSYCPIDKSKDYLLSSAETFRRYFPAVPINAFNADYFKDTIQLPKGTRPFALFFGSSISNLEGFPNEPIPEAEVIWQLGRLRQILGENGTLMMAYDSNQDESSIVKSYSHPFQREFGSNVMYRIKRDLPVTRGFDPEAWHYEPVWHAKSHLLAHTIVCDKEQVFWLGEQRFHIKAGEQFILNNSYKYPVEKMREWASKAGFQDQRHIMDHQNRQALHVLHC